MFFFGFFLNRYALEFQPPGSVGASTNYSIVSLGEDIRKASPAPDSFITYYIVVTYFIFGVGVPLLHLVFVLLLWFVKMTKQAQKGMLVATEVLNAWSGLDVLVLALIASIIEIKSFVKFMVGDKCDVINDILVKYMDTPLDGRSTINLLFSPRICSRTLMGSRCSSSVLSGRQHASYLLAMLTCALLMTSSHSEGHDVCFDVDAELKPGCWFLFGAVITHTIVANIAMSACRTVVKDREEADAVGGAGVVAKGAMYADKPRCCTRFGAALGLVRYD